MIRKLRRRHLWLWSILAVVLPLLFVASLIARRDPPRVDRIQPPLESAKPSATTDLAGTMRWQGADVETRLLARGSDASLISLTPNGRGLAADLVVYWTDSAPVIEDGLPSGARLLGSLGNGTSLLVPQTGRLASRPKAATDRLDGYLSLYSVSRRHVVAHADLSKLDLKVEPRRRSEAG